MSLTNFYLLYLLSTNSIYYLTNISNSVVFNKTCHNLELLNNLQSALHYGILALGHHFGNTLGTRLVGDGYCLSHTLLWKNWYFQGFWCQQGAVGKVFGEP